MASSVSEAIRKAGAYLADAGYAVEEAAPPELSRAAELWHELAVPDVFAALQPRMEELGDEDSKRSMRFWVDAYERVELDGFLARQIERDALITRWAQFFEDYPIVILPSSGEPPLPIDLDMTSAEGSRRGIEANRFQLAIALLALPGLSVPLGEVDGLPTGVQLVGPRFREDLLLDAGEVIETREGVRTPIDPRTG